MVKTLVALVLAKRTPLYELGGAAAITAGLTVRYGWWIGGISAGVGLLAKSLEHDLHDQALEERARSRP